MLVQRFCLSFILSLCFCLSFSLCPSLSPSLSLPPSLSLSLSPSPRPRLPVRGKTSRVFSHDLHSKSNRVIESQLGSTAMKNNPKQMNERHTTQRECSHNGHKGYVMTRAAKSTETGASSSPHNVTMWA